MVKTINKSINNEGGGFSVFSWVIYYICNLINKKGARKIDAPENYFEMEVAKSQQFDDQFSLDLLGKTILEIGCNVGGYLCHALNSGAKFVYGVEIEESKANNARILVTEKCENKNFKVFTADARDLYMVKDKSIDIVVSDAVLEHIKSVDKVFLEVARILKPGGRAYFATSPIWFTYNGGHLWRYIPIPWVHNILPDKIIIEVLKIQKMRKDFPEKASTNIIMLYQTIGKLSLHRIRSIAVIAGLKLDALRNYSNSPLKRFLIRFPILEEIFAGGIKISLRKMN